MEPEWESQRNIYESLREPIRARGSQSGSHREPRDREPERYRERASESQRDPDRASRSLSWSHREP